MKIALALLCLALSGCAYNLTLIPRAGGDVARGTASGGAMTVLLKNETYRGSGVPASTTGAFAVQTNQYKALLVSETNKTLRCEFVLSPRTGNGTCVDGGDIAYDLAIERQ